jgi:uncharacterized protein (DUF362 family)
MVGHEAQGSSRREFLRAGAALGTAAAALPLGCSSWFERRPAVSIVRVKDGRIDYAVGQAIDLLGGIRTVTAGKTRIMLKPNLVNAERQDTTKPEVIRALAQSMKQADKEVIIGEGSTAVPGFNIALGAVFRTRKARVLDAMQQSVFDRLGYSDLARSLKIPLVNLHSGKMTEVKVPGALAFDRITLHRSLAEVDLCCSVPMMKTHGLAGVTLGLKNLIGAFPGTVYFSPRRQVHDRAVKVEPTGTAAAILDMARAVKPGLVVIDATTAMEGQGPSVKGGGRLVKMGLIVAGTNPLATDMVAAAVMGFAPTEIPALAWARRAGLRPTKLTDIEIRGESLARVGRQFARPRVVPWNYARPYIGAREL